MLLIFRNDVVDCEHHIDTNCLYSGHCRDLEFVSSLTRVRNSGVFLLLLFFFSQTSVFFFLANDLVAVRIIGVSVIARCPQGKS